MGEYFILLNDSNREQVSVLNFNKRVQILENAEPQKKLFAYFFDHLGDSFRFISDDSDAYDEIEYDYVEVVL